MDPKEALLRKVSSSYLFNIFTDAEIERLLGCAQVEAYADGGLIFSQGDQPDKFYLILYGSVTITQSIPHTKGNALADLGEGETLGEMSFLDRFPRSASAVAKGNAQLLAFEFAAFDDLIAGDKDLAVKWFWLFGRALAERLREANERIKQLIEERVDAHPSGLPMA